MSLLTSGL